MKKYLIVLALLVAPFVSKAETPAGVLGFMDGKYYDESQSLKYICFLDSQCYDLNQKFAFKREVAGVSTTTPITTVQSGFTLFNVPNQWFPREVNDAYITGSIINVLCYSSATEDFITTIRCQNRSNLPANVKQILFNITVKDFGDYRTINDSLQLSLREDLILPFYSDSINTKFPYKTSAKIIYTYNPELNLPLPDLLDDKTTTVLRIKTTEYKGVLPSLILINVDGKDIIFKIN